VGVRPLRDATLGDVGHTIWVVLGAVGLLLAIACANVANLFLARGLGRTREMAVRRALGADTLTLAAQLLVESLVVGLAGGLLGSALAWGGIRAFVALNPTALPRQAAVAVDPQVLGFTIAVSIVTSLVFGLLPALSSVRHELADELRLSGRSATSGRGVSLLRSTLVAGEVALSLVLVAGAGLLLRSFLAVRAQDPGFAVADVWTVPLNLPQPDTPAEYLQTMEAVVREVRSVPGVRDAAYGLTVPMDRVGGSRCCWRSRAALPGREEDRSLDSMFHPVSVDYFTTLGVELTAGRSWTEGEAEADPVPMVVNATLAREMAGTPEAAVGLAVKLNQLAAIVVGVAADTRHYGLDQDIGNQLYLPVERLPFPIPLATVAVHVDPSANRSMPAALRAAVWAAVPSLPVTTVRSMREAVDASTALRRFESVVFGAFGVIALLLAAGGLYGTLLYVAGQRRRELGIRLALGATRAHIQAQVLRAGVTLAVVGLLVGLAGAWAATRLLESLVWGVGRGDPWALGGATVLLLGTAALASWLPARRAGRVDPVETLRAE
jgi:predicted permease